MANQQLVAGVDSSTQSVKVVIREATTGQLIREGRVITLVIGENNGTYT